jgi:hypothetical protein
MRDFNSFWLSRQGQKGKKPSLTVRTMVKCQIGDSLLPGKRTTGEWRLLTGGTCGVVTPMDEQN